MEDDPEIYESDSDNSDSDNSRDSVKILSKKKDKKLRTLGTWQRLQALSLKTRWDLLYFFILNTIVNLTLSSSCGVG
jgi:hypothetical protein